MEDIESKVSCSASRDVHTWNIIVPQRLVSLCTHLVDSDHLHTGGIFDCPVAWSPSTPLFEFNHTQIWQTHPPGLCSVFVYNPHTGCYTMAVFSSCAFTR